MVETKEAVKVVYKSGETNIITCIVRDENNIEVSQFGREPIFDIMAQNPGAIICTIDEATVLIEKVLAEEYSKPWIEIDQEQYDEMLNVLPPENWHQGEDYSAFRMCEYMQSNYTGHYARIGKRYFYATRQSMPNYRQYFDEIKEQFDLQKGA